MKKGIILATNTEVVFLGLNFSLMDLGLPMHSECLSVHV